MTVCTKVFAGPKIHDVCYMTDGAWQTVRDIRCMRGGLWRKLHDRWCMADDECQKVRDRRGTSECNRQKWHVQYKCWKLYARSCNIEYAHYDRKYMTEGAWQWFITGSVWRKLNDISWMAEVEWQKFNVRSWMTEAAWHTLDVQKLHDISWMTEATWHKLDDRSCMA